ncbi:protein translocase subunit SecD, partial [Erwinia amylovora]|nr:protein translocase subunit SecD [Erwinia amylovora]
LAKLSAETMKLGVDVRGGVHFLMDVDMDTGLGILQDQNIDNLRIDLREKSDTYVNVIKTVKYGLEIRFRDHKTREEAFSSLTT